MQIKRYTHRFLQVVTDRYLLRVIDTRQDTPKSKVTLLLSGAFKEEAYLSRETAIELRDALTRAIRNMPKELAPQQKENNE